MLFALVIYGDRRQAAPRSHQVARRQRVGIAPMIVSDRDA
jgi:hypothetical protein